MNSALRILGITLLCATVAVAGEGLSTLTNVRYNVQSFGSRVTLRFEGAATYSVRESHEQVIFAFSRTRVASPPGAARLSFQSGHVKSLTIDRLPADSARVVLTLADGTGYSVRPMKEGSELEIDVIRTRNVAAVPLPAPTKPQAKLANPKPGVPAEKKSSLVDIPAIARNQIAAESAPQPRQTPEPARHETPVTSPQTTSGMLSPLILVAVVLVILGAGIGMLLWLASKRQYGVAKKSVIAVAPGPAPHKSHLTVSPLHREVKKEAEETDVLDDETGDDETSLDESTLRLGRSFQRGEEEMNLVARLRSRSETPVMKKSMTKTLNASATQSQRLTAARKLGIGTGEVDLAIHLKKFSQKSFRKEGEQ